MEAEESRETTMISRWAEFGLRSIGVWPDTAFARFYRCLWVVGMTLALTFQFWYIIVRIGIDNMLDLLDCFSTSLSYVVAFSKLLFFWINRRNAKLSVSYSNWIMGIDVSAVMFYSLAIIVTKSLGPKTDVVDPSNSTRTFILKMEFPFESRSSPVYEIIIFVQTVHAVAMVIVAASIDAVVVSLILHVSGQIDIIRERLVSANNDKNSALSVIASLVEKHQRIITFSENIENLYSYIALVQFLVLTLLICCIGLRLVISLDSRGEFLIVTLLELFGYYVSKNMEAFVICYAGEYLSEKSKSIGDAAYDSLWYNTTKRECNVLLPLMLRSQKRLTITIGKFMDLSLERFASILKASASYMSVLYALY